MKIVKRGFTPISIEIQTHDELYALYLAVTTGLRELSASTHASKLKLEGLEILEDKLVELLADAS